MLSWFGTLDLALGLINSVVIETTRQSWYKASSMEFSIHRSEATLLPRFHLAIDCQARMLRTYQPLSSKRRLRAAP
jgi:hypothetical protein